MAPRMTGSAPRILPGQWPELAETGGSCVPDSGHSTGAGGAYTRGHFWRPKAVCSMRRLTAGEGAHWPPRARNRVLASATVVSRLGCPSASASSARARTWGSDSGDTRAPFFLNVKILNEERSTAIGFPFMSATAISALRSRWPAKRGRRWRTGSRSMRSKAAFGTRYRVSSASSK